MMEKTISKYLYKVVLNHPRDCDKYLSFFLMTYRSSLVVFEGKLGEDLAESDLRRKMDNI